MSSKNTPKTPAAKAAEAQEVADQVKETVELTGFTGLTEAEPRKEEEPPAEEDYMARIRDLLTQPKVPGQLITLSRYKVSENRYYYFEYEVSGDAYEEAWSLYRKAKGNDEPGFIQLVNTILDATPRMHRGVSYKPLS